MQAGGGATGVSDCLSDEPGRRRSQFRSGQQHLPGTRWQSRQATAKQPAKIGRDRKQATRRQRPGIRPEGPCQLDRPERVSAGR